MKTSNRFNNAITKLYTAFHNNTLNPEDFKQCAVGSILDNKDSWKYLTNIHGSVRLSYIGLVHQNLGRKFNGYSPLELLQIEASFLIGCGYNLGENHCHKPKETLDKNILFNGLCRAISTLCELCNLNNILDYSILLEPNVDVILTSNNTLII